MTRPGIGSYGSTRPSSGAAVEIICEVMSDDPERMAIAIWDGVTFKDLPADPVTGEIRQIKAWVWIPRSQISDREDHDNGTTTLFIPEWLATKQRLV
jgi:hypothetical protein